MYATPCYRLTKKSNKCVIVCHVLKHLLKVGKFLYISIYFHWNAVHGGWSSWSGWTSCSQSCTTGFQERSRNCTSPPPRYGGNYCHGDARENQTCNKQPCPGKKEIIYSRTSFIRTPKNRPKYHFKRFPLEVTRRYNVIAKYFILFRQHFNKSYIL